MAEREYISKHSETIRTLTMHCKTNFMLFEKLQELDKTLIILKQAKLQEREYKCISVK